MVQMAQVRPKQFPEKSVGGRLAEGASGRAGKPTWSLALAQPKLTNAGDKYPEAEAHPANVIFSQLLVTESKKNPTML